mmetsp:Transcript_115933/g.368680  ORF Transcript_115933/g.368680 Transcript_115933/m.368680 type:complete len:294 (-) Transcript_115933:1304-2185(-)
MHPQHRQARERPAGHLPSCVSTLPHGWRRVERVCEAPQASPLLAQPLPKKPLQGVWTTCTRAAGSAAPIRSGCSMASNCRRTACQSWAATQRCTARGLINNKLLANALPLEALECTSAPRMLRSTLKWTSNPPSSDGGNHDCTSKGLADRHASAPGRLCPCAGSKSPTQHLTLGRDETWSRLAQASTLCSGSAWALNAPGAEASVEHWLSHTSFASAKSCRQAQLPKSSDAMLRISQGEAGGKADVNKSAASTATEPHKLRCPATDKRSKPHQAPSSGTVRSSSVILEDSGQE